MAIRGRGAFRPELPAAMQRLERLNGVLPYKVFENIEHYPGLSDPQLAALLDVRPSRLADALAQLNQGEDEERVAAAVARLKEATGRDEEADGNTIGDLLREANRGELLVRIPVYSGPKGALTSNAALVPRLEDGNLPTPRFHMNYVSVEGTIIIGHRDDTSLAAIRRRVHEDIRKDHHPYAPQLTHTHQQNDCLVAMSRHGYLVSAGYRGPLYLPGGQQLVPDARLTAHLCLDDLPTEYMRAGNRSWWGAKGEADRGEIQRQLRQYVPQVRRLGGLVVACLCENETVVEAARDEAASISRDYDVALQVLAVLERHVTHGDATPGRPDLGISSYTIMHWYVEYERSATTPAAIRGKLMPYFRVARRAYDCPALFICETQTAADIFREQHRNLRRELGVAFPLITSTYAQVTAGDQFDTCWNLDGRHVQLDLSPGNSRASQAAIFPTGGAVSWAETQPREGTHGKFQICEPVSSGNPRAGVATPSLNATQWRG